MLLRKAFRYRLYPTPEQATRLDRWCDTLRFLWNLANEQRIIAYAHPRDYRRYPSAFDQANELTGLRTDLPWLADVPRNVSTQLLVNLDTAWQRCWRRLADAPRWKRRGRDVIGLTEPHPKVWRLDGETLHFPKIGPMRVVIHRPLVGKPKTCTIKRDGDQWFCSIVCEIEIAEPVPSTKPPIGIDRGCVNLLADSNGRVVENPRHLRHAEKRLRRAQRTVSRRKKGSKNRARAIARLNRIHRKVRRQRDHVLHCESKRYAKSQGVVVLEALRIKNMVRVGSGLARSIGSAGWSRFAAMLRYKSIETGALVIEVPAAYTSQTCAECGVVDEQSRNGERYQCRSCGHTAHADVNAARNILSRRTDGAAACGGSAEVRRPMKQELRVARRGTRSQGLGSLSKAPAFRPG